MITYHPSATAHNAPILNYIGKIMVWKVGTHIRHIGPFLYTRISSIRLLD